MKRAVLMGYLSSLLAGCEPPAPPRVATSPAAQVAPPPAIDSTGEDCAGSCVSYLTSSNPRLRPYALKQFSCGELTVARTL